MMIVLHACKKDLQKNPRSVISVIFNVALMPDLSVITRKKYALHFSIGPLSFSLGDLLNLLESLEKNVEVLKKNKGHTSLRNEITFSFL